MSGIGRRERDIVLGGLWLSRPDSRWTESDESPSSSAKPGIGLNLAVEHREFQARGLFLCGVLFPMPYKDSHWGLGVVRPLFRFSYPRLYQFDFGL